jgi:NAD(P)-dependent dehydrogenase (short-subunit alcohol dehydrogenase family)
MTPGTWERLLADRVTIVTGAAGGIGAACASLAAAHGARVVVSDLPDRGAAEVAAGLPGDAIAVEADIAREDDVDRLVATTVEQWGTVHTLVNVAALTGAALVDDKDVASTPLATWDRVLEVNLRGTMLCCRAVVPVMLEQGGGSIVNVSSNAALRGSRGLAAYSASKAAVNSLTRHLAVAYGKRGIRCNAIMPGVITGTRSIDWTDEPERYRAAAEKNVATSRLGAPADVANLAVFLAADAVSGYVTGQVVSCDGGYSARL